MYIDIGRKTKTTIQIDPEVYRRVKSEGWTLNRTSHGYVRLVKYAGKVDGKYRYESKYLHQYIKKPNKGFMVDHIDGDRLNNKSDNLRVCRPSGNARNARSSSGYKGVHFNKKNEKWTAQITKDYKCYHIGMFKTEKEAAKEYNKHAKRLHGKYAFLNQLQ